MTTKTTNFEDYLKCRLCGSGYTDPVITECGETGCRECIKKTISSENTNEYTCPFCSQTHQISQHGFIPNNFVRHLIENQPTNSETQLTDVDFLKKLNIEQLDFNLKNIRVGIDKINSIIKYPSDDLDEYCSNLKQEIELTTENNIQLLNKFKDELISKVDEYQAENKEGFKSPEVDFTRIEEFYDQWKQRSDWTSLSEGEILDVVNRSNNYKSFLQSYLPFVRLNILSDAEFVLDFNGNPNAFSSPNIIGYVGYNRRVIRNFDTLEEIDLSLYIKNQPDYYIRITPLDNGNYILAYPATRDGHQMTALCILNKEFQKQHKVYINFNLRDIAIYSFSHSIIVTVKEEIKRILFYDLNLYFIKETKLTPYPMDAFVFLDESTIYMYSVEDPTKTFYYKCDFTDRRSIPKLLLFSSSLVHVPFANAAQVESFESKLYFRHENKISIIDQHDGSFVNSVSGVTDQCDFVIDRKNACLIAFDGGMNKLLYFTTKGNQFYDYEIKNLPKENFNICYSRLHGLSIYIPEKAKIYI